MFLGLGEAGWRRDREGERLLRVYTFRICRKISSFTKGSGLVRVLLCNGPRDGMWSDVMKAIETAFKFGCLLSMPQSRISHNVALNNRGPEDFYFFDRLISPHQNERDTYHRHIHN
jgi:hypothetical protein